MWDIDRNPARWEWIARRFEEIRETPGSKAAEGKYPVRTSIMDKTGQSWDLRFSYYPRGALVPDNQPLPIVEAYRAGCEVIFVWRGPERHHITNTVSVDPLRPHR